MVSGGGGGGGASASWGSCDRNVNVVIDFIESWFRVLITGRHRVKNAIVEESLYLYYVVVFRAEISWRIKREISKVSR